MNAVKILSDIICKTLLDANVLERARLRNGAFKRNCGKLPYWRVVMILMKNVKKTISASLDEFFTNLCYRFGGSITDTIHCSQQAFSKARAGFSHTVFKECFERMLDFLCSPESHSYDKRLMGIWGLQIIAIDGSKIELPNRKHFLEKYGGTGRDASSPTALASIAYDVLNKRIIDAQFEPLAVGERNLAKRHIENIRCNNRLDLLYTMFVFDRGYASSNLISYIEDNIHGCYLFRLRSKFNVEMDNIPTPTDGSVADHTLTYNFRKIRVLKFVLPGGVTETLITNNFDLDKEMFRMLYFLRWQAETEYDFVKNKIGLTNFRGHSENSVLQEFWISIVIANLASSIRVETDAIIDQTTNKKNNKYRYKTNTNELVGYLSRHFDEYMDAYLDYGNTAMLFDVIKGIFDYALAHRVRDKKGTNESNPRNSPRSVKFHYNRKATH